MLTAPIGGLQIHALSTMLATYKATHFPRVLRLLAQAGLPQPCHICDATVRVEEVDYGLDLFLVARIRAYVTVGDFEAHHHSLLVATNAALQTWCALTYPHRGNWELDPWFELPHQPWDLARRTLSRQYQVMATHRSHRSAPPGHRFVSGRPPWEHGRFALTRVAVPA